MRNKLVLCSVAAAIGLSAPTASADMVDDYLAKVPAGQISCEQATKYYTNPSDYNSKKSQALAAANFHPRGGEIRDAIARADEAIARCGLNGGGGGGNTAPAQNTAPANNGGHNANNGGGAPANNGNNANNAGQNTSSFALPTLNTIPVHVGNFTFQIPDIVEFLKALVGELQSAFLN